jgi:hypothetical protein
VSVLLSSQGLFFHGITASLLPAEERDAISANLAGCCCSSSPAPLLVIQDGVSEVCIADSTDVYTVATMNNFQVTLNANR